MIIQICVGSACHLKGSEKLVGLFEDALKKYDLENDVTLAGSFCTGRCNREGVTISVDDDVYTGITPEGFNNSFFEEKVLKRIRKRGCDGMDCLTLKKSNCKNCYKCIRHCPVKSIRSQAIRHILSATNVSSADSALSLLPAGCKADS